MVSYLCDLAGVSRTGYYNHWTAASQERRDIKEAQDLLVKETILKAYRFNGRHKGARQIKMTLQGKFNMTYNVKRIRRIMKKYEIICPIRRANPYKKMMKATKEHRAVSNLLNREFKQFTPGKVLLTDITYLFMEKDRKLTYPRLKMAPPMRF